jgi:hypothetical protein
MFSNACEFNSSGDQIKENVMGGACGTYEGEKRCTQGFGGNTERKRLLGRPMLR